MSYLREKYIALPPKKKKAINSFCEIFQTAGYECFLVGGSCRDLLLGIEPSDFDFASNCPLSIIRTLFPKVVATGESHGTLTVLYSGFQFEVTRYRKDVSTDGRRAAIEFADSIEDDLKRRDLRLNALAYNVLEDHIVDSQNALRDFKEKIIRFVGNARDRILEDHLRALRYGRMIVMLKSSGFKYLPEEMEQVIRVFDNGLLSVERLFDELSKILILEPRDDDFLAKFFIDLKVLNRFDLDSIQTKEVIWSILKTSSLLPLWYSHHRTHPLSETAKLMRLNKQNKRLIHLILEFENQDFADEFVIKKFLSRANGIGLEQLITSVQLLLNADISEQTQKMIENNDPLYMKDLVVSGSDLIGMGIKGKKIGITLDYLLENVWKHPQVNRRQTLLKMAKDFLTELDD